MIKYPEDYDFTNGSSQIEPEPDYTLDIPSDDSMDMDANIDQGLDNVI